jgi:hypothetical protein
MDRRARSAFIEPDFRTPSPCRMNVRMRPFTDGKNVAALPANAWCSHA